jgi:Methylase involved in ubiquinone/menaquinone biosynthesis
MDMGNGETTLHAAPAQSGSLVDSASGTRESQAQPAVASDPLTERSVKTWSAGAFDRIAAGYRGEAEAFIGRLALARGQRVLDAACGSGNLTIPAARTGASVTGFDLIPELLSVAASWATREGLDIAFDQGSVEELPYADASFDVVTSMFGVMFAARPERVAAELARVTRSGGRLALATWPREGFIGQMLARHMAYMPTKSTLPSPLLWGDAAVIRERLDARDWNVSVAQRTLTFHFPHSPAGTAQLFCTSYGPTVRLMESLDEEQRALFTRDLTDHWASRQRGSEENTVVDAEYVEVIATRR